MHSYINLIELKQSRIAFVDTVGQDQTVDNVQSDL